MRARSLALLLSLAFPAVASAEGVPGFALMDRGDDRPRVVASFGFTSFDGFDLTGQRLDLHGHYAPPHLDLGAYAALAWGRIATELGAQSGLGNVEVGALYQLSGDVPVTVRGGIALPIAGDDGATVASLSGMHRLTDLAAQLPGAATLRLSASPMLREGHRYFRADIGLDLPGHDRIDMVLRFNVGGGVDLGAVSLQGSLVNLIILDENRNNEMHHVVGLGVGYLGHPLLQPTLTLAVPLDSDLRQLADFLIVLGVDLALPPRQPAKEATPAAI
jgi:hypothetical protein